MVSTDSNCRPVLHRHLRRQCHPGAVAPLTPHTQQAADALDLDVNATVRHRR